MKLETLIQKLEQEIAGAGEDTLPKLYLNLCEHLAWVNNTKLSMYCNLVLNHTGLSDKHPYKLEAKLYQAGLLMNQLSITEAKNLLESIADEISLLNNTDLMIDWQRHYSLAMVYSGQPDEGIKLIERCIETALPYADSTRLCNTYAIAAICYYERDLAKAGHYAMQSLEYAKQSEKQWLIGYATLMLGYWARENKIEDKTLLNFSAAVELLQQSGADEYYANSLMQLSIAYKDKEMFDEAIKLLDVAIPVLDKIQNKRLAIIANYSAGRCYRAMKKFTEAEKHYKLALATATAENINYEMAVCNTFLGYLYRDMDKVDIAIHHLENAIALFGQNFLLSAKADLYKHLHPMYLQTGEIRKAYDTLLTYTDIRFKLQDENRIKEATHLQEKYEAEKKEAELQKNKLQQIESELKALKAQMNPHFIFNSLNSIQEVFFTGDKRLANEQLSRFSQLMRNILQASSRHSVSLQEEVNMLKEYMDLEALRLGSSFTYSIGYDNSVDVYTLEIPPMTLQPFIENAIKHGLQHKAGAKHITVSFTFNCAEEILTCTIDDNGIGRKASETINRKRIGHQSFASSAITHRFQMLNQNSDRHFSYVYTDKADAHGNATGTTVSITIPCIFQ